MRAHVREEAIAELRGRAGPGLQALLHPVEPELLPSLARRLDDAVGREHERVERLERDGGDLVDHVVEEAERRAREKGAKSLADALKQQAEAFDKRRAEAQALRELGRALEGQLDPEALEDLKEFGSTGDPEAGRRLAEAMGKALSKLSEEERKRLAEQLKKQIAQSPQGAPQAMTAEELEAGRDFGRYKDVDGDGIPWRTLPGTHPSKGSYFTRGTTRDAYARYSERGPDYIYNVQRLLKKFETAATLVPQPVLRKSAHKTRLGVIYFGSTSPAMHEALEMLNEAGIQIMSPNYMADPPEKLGVPPEKRHVPGVKKAG